MGNKTLERKTDEPQENYRIITYQAKDLPEDLYNLIIAPMLNTLKSGNKMLQWVDRDAWYGNYKTFINSLLTRPKAMVSLALLDDDTIVGWSMFEDSTVHYVWVKAEARGSGICSALLPKPFTVATHMTNAGRVIWVTKYPYVKYNPWA